jgi:hypothetical protein
MSEFDYRVDMGAKWFARHVIEDPGGGAGWGWVPDVPPNPQNTAEVICALTRVGRPIPHKEEALTLMRRKVVAHGSHGDWAFSSHIDAAWRLRGLRCIVGDPEDRDIVDCARSLLEAQEDSSGGWRMAGSAGSVSVTATCLALIALSGLDGPIEVEPAVQRGMEMLADAVLEDDPRAVPLYASAQIAQVLARPDIRGLGGPRVERARETALNRVATGLRQDSPPGIQEEIFTRGEVTDIWRHMTLYLSLAARADAAPDHIFQPTFRHALIEMLDLQEEGVDNINFGGFRTSKEGFVTSYATTQALHALASTNTALSGQVNPGRAFDLLCRSAGTHHSDPQDVVTMTGRTVTMNSWAGAVVFFTSLVASLTIAALTIAFQEDLGNIGSGLLLMWSTFFLAGGSFVFASVRLPKVSNGRIALVIFTAFTAIFLPIIFFVFA